MPMCELDFSPLKNLGDVIEVGDIIGNVKLRKHYTMRILEQSENYAILAIETAGQIKSPLRGVLVKLGGNAQQASTYRIGDPLCFIKIDHDTAPTIKIISD